MAAPLKNVQISHNFVWIKIETLSYHKSIYALNLVF